MLINVLNLNDSQDGNRIKQGDLSHMRYILTDTNKDDLNLDGLPAKVFLTDETGVKYIYDTTVRQYDNAYVCDVVINQIIPANIYTLEIWVDNKYVFPSDKKTKIEVTESVIGRQLINTQNHDLWQEMIEYGVKNGLIKNQTETEVNYSPLKNLTGVFIGDSITEVNFRTSKNYHQFIAERTGLNVINLGVSGTGYVDRINAVDSITEQPDFISVFLGTNDYSGVTGSKLLGDVTDTDAPTVASHIYALLNNLINKFPNTPVLTITPLPRIESNPYDENKGENGYSLYELSKVIKGVSKRLGVPCLDLYHCSHLRPWIDEVNQHFFSYQEVQADGLHPNYRGHEYISYPIQSFLEQHAIVGEIQPFVSDEAPVIKIVPKASFETLEDGSTLATIPSVQPTWIEDQSFMLRIPVETLNLKSKKIAEVDYNGNKILKPNDILNNSPFWYAVSSYPKGEFNRIDEINDFVQHLNYVGDTEYGKTYKPITIKIKYK
ncbi:SGNH/GDSL hydrolase family protein [Staphylococcus capitis]|uniref:SGNH/GDSL hydrolase family protein n=1 Tax=Staphylococcus capitis TaxID=29388 RepID=UPI002DBCF0C4|nr:SGNH/GDSL hydrolase family protein [Staphylococcus capitis]MEB5628912.1 SGNH/GDSL hydrolase family protein [Staphylococcus capitis]MED7775710.1 SGNH/GDSL hydrolase family protein [Staphylococcus capitis]